MLTGATGLVGSWVLERLLALGADPVCLVRDRTPCARAATGGALDRATVVFGDLTDHDLLVRTLNEYEVRTVVHLGAQTIVGIANRHPLSTFESNVRGTWNLLEACRIVGGLESIVVASSDKAYGHADTLPYSESFPLRGRHPYDVSKSCADLITASYWYTYGLPVTITRCGNFYGGGDLNFNRLVPGTIRSALRGHRPTVRSDGTMRRDYVYVEDAADAYLLLAERAAGDVAVHGEAFNFSNHEPVTVLEVVERILLACGRPDLRPEILGTATNEIPEQYLNAGKARQVLGWSPRVDLDEGLGRTVRWYRSFLANGRSSVVAG